VLAACDLSNKQDQAFLTEKVIPEYFSRVNADSGYALFMHR
jgi:hypothetical protein